MGVILVTLVVAQVRAKPPPVRQVDAGALQRWCMLAHVAYTDQSEYEVRFEMGKQGLHVLTVLPPTEPNPLDGRL